MLTYNAPEFVEIAVRTVRDRTCDVNFELVVVDNASEEPTRGLLHRLDDEGLIDTLHFSPTNTLFAGGNNLAATLAAPDATHFLLLNSDVEIRDDAWLSNLLSHHSRGASSYGMVPDPLRVDGYCYLIDADLYRSAPLDEEHQWFWAITKQQAGLLSADLSVRGYFEHERYVHHFGGRSGTGFTGAKGLSVDRLELDRWFGGRSPIVIDLHTLPLLTRVDLVGPEFVRRAVHRIQRVRARAARAVSRRRP
ncbi:hypothetical protein GCM10017607_22940 [Microbacterium thalassium]|nr:glycosyltransferase [Microbacterium thalassium]GLK24976.1 hypothetical protein GCM10017607_22940 [Microbacterium thalassium]